MGSGGGKNGGSHGRLGRLSASRRRSCRADVGRFRLTWQDDVGLCVGGHLWRRRNSAAMSSPRWHVRRHGIYGCGHLFLSFCLETKGPKVQGRHHGPTTLGNRPSPMSARPARPTRSVFGVPIHSEQSSHVIPTLACARHGIYGCGLALSSVLL